jgi:hypothetical protein
VTLPSGTGFGGARPFFSPGAGPGGGPAPNGSFAPTGSVPSGGSFPRGGSFPGGGGGPGGGGLFGTAAPAGVDQSAWTTATQACQSLRPTAGPNGGNANNSALAAYRNCLAEHGVRPTTGPVNTADPTYVAAEQACAALRPNRATPSASPSAG